MVLFACLYSSPFRCVSPDLRQEPVWEIETVVKCTVIGQNQIYKKKLLRTQKKPVKPSWWHYPKSHQHNDSVTTRTVAWTLFCLFWAWLGIRKTFTSCLRFAEEMAYFLLFWFPYHQWGLMSLDFCICHLQLVKIVSTFDDSGFLTLISRGFKIA